MTPLRARPVELAALGMAFSILATVAALSYWSIRSATDTLGWLEHTAQVLQQLDVRSSIKFL